MRFYQRTCMASPQSLLSAACLLSVPIGQTRELFYSLISVATVILRLANRLIFKLAEVGRI